MLLCFQPKSFYESDDENIEAAKPRRVSQHAFYEESDPTNTMDDALDSDDEIRARQVSCSVLVMLRPTTDSSRRKQHSNAPKNSIKLTMHCANHYNEPFKTIVQTTERRKFDSSCVVLLPIENVFFSVCLDVFGVFLLLSRVDDTDTRVGGENGDRRRVCRG